MLLIPARTSSKTEQLTTEYGFLVLHTLVQIKFSLGGVNKF